MILYIDTTDFSKVIFAVSDGKKIRKKSYKIDPHKSHESLQKLGEFLKQVKSQKLKVKNIVVNKGPGSYTGVRVGVAHALALGFAWGVPVHPVRDPKFKEILSAL